jgi:hypothetical protein
MSREFDIKHICKYTNGEKEKSSLRIGARMSREFDIKHICKYTSGE